MSGTIGGIVDVDVEELAPRLLWSWLGKSSATGLLGYLWNEYLNGRTVADDELGSAEDALRFLAIAKVCTEALDIAEEGSGHDPWNGVDAPFDLIHPFTLGYLLAARKEPVDFADSPGFHLSTLIGSHRGEALGELAHRVTASEFFIAIWSAHPAWNIFRPGPGTWLTMTSIWMNCNGPRGRCWTMRAMSGPAFPMHRQAAPCFRGGGPGKAPSPYAHYCARGHHCGSNARRSAMNSASGCSSSLSSRTSKAPTMP